jgi:hypothetical protein
MTPPRRRRDCTANNAATTSATTTTTTITQTHKMSTSAAVIPGPGSRGSRNPRHHETTPCDQNQPLIAARLRGAVTAISRPARIKCLHPDEASDARRPDAFFDLRFAGDVCCLIGPELNH